MRAMGPGSVSSLLKTALDVVYLIFWGFGALLTAGALVAAAVPFDPNLVATGGEGANMVQIQLTKPIVVGGLLMAAVYFAVLVVVIGQLRRVFATLSVGDPFHPNNVNRLRLIALGLVGLEFLNIIVRMAVRHFLPGVPQDLSLLSGATAWLAILVVVALVLVFREGARLRREAELTI